MRKPTPQKVTVCQALGIGVFGLVLAGLPILAYFQYDHPGIVMVLAFFYIVTAFVLQSRLIISTLCGALMGLIFAGNVKGVELDSYLLRILAGALIGLVVGFVWDRAESMLPLDVPRGKKKR